MGNRKTSKAVRVVRRTERGAIERWLTGNGQALAPMLELIENAQVRIDELMHEAACGLTEQLLLLSAQEVAGETSGSETSRSDSIYSSEYMVV